MPIPQRTVPYCINFILQVSKEKEIQQAELQSATENGRLSLQAVPPSSSQPTTAAFPCSTITNTATHWKMLQGSLNPFRGLDQRQKGAPHAPQRLAKAVGWSGVDFNLLKFRTVITRMETKFQKKVSLARSFSSKSLDVDVYSSTEWTGDHQDNLLCLYLLTIPTHFPNNTLVMQFSFWHVWFEHNLKGKHKTLKLCPLGLLVIGT